MTVVYLIVALLIILVSAELFTNSVEWFGRRYGLGEGAVGSVLAAVGTALPETLVPIMALVFLGGDAGPKIGVGAILGAPFMLSSLAMCVTGTAVVIFSLTGRRTLKVSVNETVMRRDLAHFLRAYALAMIAGLVHITTLHWLLAGVLIVVYGWYVYVTMREEGDLEGDSKPLYFHRGHGPDLPHAWRIVLQMIVALGGIVAGAEFFVEQVRNVSVALGASPLMVALLIAPVATELPEKFNSVIWIRQRKDTLALGNITGAMVFQSTFPVSVGLLFTQWDLPFTALLSGILALMSGTVFYVTLRVRHTLTWWSLAGAGSMYAVYLIYVLGFAHT
jgi:cation:H+ antiporter